MGPDADYSPFDSVRSLIFMAIAIVGIVWAAYAMLTTADEKFYASIEQRCLCAGAVGYDFLQDRKTAVCIFKQNGSTPAQVMTVIDADKMRLNEVIRSHPDMVEKFDEESLKFISNQCVDGAAILDRN